MENEPPEYFMAGCYLYSVVGSTITGIKRNDIFYWIQAAIFCNAIDGIGNFICH